jgi:hypothetical protein
MARAGESPTPPDRSAIGRRVERETEVREHETGIEQTERGESYGPVTLTRYEKGDGRPLILYTHDDGRGRA